MYGFLEVCALAAPSGKGVVDNNGEIDLPSNVKRVNDLLKMDEQKKAVPLVQTGQSQKCREFGLTSKPIPRQKAGR